MQNRNRNAFIPALVLMAIGAMALFGQGNGLAILMILFGLLFLVRQFDNRTVSLRSQDDYEEEYEYMRARQRRVEERPAHSEPIYRHALDAVSRAGRDPDEISVLPVDIGVLAFRGDEKPVVHRTWSLADDLDYIQPFVQLRIPTQARGKVRFEILDANDEVLFAHEDYHNLERGRNLITPGARLPVHDQYEMDGRWRMRVITDGVTLAEHDFQWAEATSPTVREHIGEDGELTTGLRVAMKESQLPEMSLDDLLAFQEDGEIANRS